MPFAGRHRWMRRLVPELRPVRAELPDRDGEHDQRQPHQPEDVSMVENFTRQMTNHTREPDERDPQQVVDAR